MFREILLCFQKVPIRDINERSNGHSVLCEAAADKVSSRAFSFVCKPEFCSKEEMSRGMCCVGMDHEGFGYRDGRGPAG